MTHDNAILRSGVSFATALFLPVLLLSAATAHAENPPLTRGMTEDGAISEGLWNPQGLGESVTGDPVVVCFKEGTSPEFIERIHQLVYGDTAMPRYFLGGRWIGPQGNPLVLTWSFVPDGTLITDSSGGTSNLFAQMDAKFGAQGGRATWVARIQACFDRWEELTGLSFNRVTTGGNDWDDGASWPGSSQGPTRGHIRICGRTLGVNGTLAYAYFPGTGDMLIDMAENWGNSTNQHRFLRDTVMHELAHTFGVDHMCSSGSSQLMEPFINTSFDGPQHDDIRAVQRHYGDPNESDNSVAAASDLGAISVGASLTVGTLPPPDTGLSPFSTSLYSIDADGESDFFEFSVSESAVVSITLTPRGFTYDNQPQLGNGNCPACCNNIDSLTIADLNVQLIDTDGTTVLATASAAGAGSNETITDALLPAAGAYFIRIYEGNTPTESQLYQYTVSVESLPCEAPVIDQMADDASICSVPYSSPGPIVSGTAPFVWSLGGTPPPGLTIDSGTGVVSWPNPVAAATPYAITVQASSDCGAGNDSVVYQLTVKPGDFTGDGLVTDIDVPMFVDHLLEVIATTPCAADVNLDGFNDALDVQAFIDSI